MATKRRVHFTCDADRLKCMGDGVRLEVTSPSGGGSVHVSWSWCDCVKINQDLREEAES
jgi:hypothetical protein